MEKLMPLIDINVIEGVFTPEQKQSLITDVTDAVVAIEGENLRSVTWVRILEVKSGDWAIGGQRLQSGDVQDMARGSS